MGTGQLADAHGTPVPAAIEEEQIGPNPHDGSLLECRPKTGATVLLGLRRTVDDLDPRAAVETGLV